MDDVDNVISLQKREAWQVDITKCIKHWERYGGTELIVFEPGNATRYVLTIAYLAKHRRGKKLLGGMDVVVSLVQSMNGSVLMSQVSVPGADYLAEKLRLSEADTRPIRALLLHVFKHTTDGTLGE